MVAKLSVLPILIAGAICSASEPPQVELVRTLYKTFAWQAIMDGKGNDDLVAQPRAVLEGYFDSALVELIRREDACRHGELCALEFDPLFASQDPFLHDLAIERSAKPDEVIVSFKQLDGTKERKVSIRFHLSKTPSGWRITDVVYSKTMSLKQLLSSNPQ